MFYSRRGANRGDKRKEVQKIDVGVIVVVAVVVVVVVDGLVVYVDGRSWKSWKGSRYGKTNLKLASS